MKKQQHSPTITDTISLPFITEVAIAPGGRYVAYVVQTADWVENKYVLTCFVHDLDQNDTREIAKNTWHPRWLDDNTLVVLHCDIKNPERPREQPQVWLFRIADICGMQITFSPHGIEQFWCYGNGIIYRTATSPSARAIEQEQQRNSYIHVGQEPRTAQLFYTSLLSIDAYKKISMDVPSNNFPKTLRLTDKLDSSLRMRGLCLSSNTLYLNCQFQQNFDEVHVWRLSANPTELEQIAVFETDGESLPPWVQLNLPSRATVLDTAPDGDALLINWDGGRSKFFSNEPWSLWTCLSSVDGSVSDLYCLTTHFKRQILAARWNTEDIYLHYINGTTSCLARLDTSGQLEVLDFGDIYPLKSFDISKAGVLAFVAGGPSGVPELVVVPKMECSFARPSSVKTQKITAFNALSKDWTWGTTETIHWKSRDNTKIEGVLFKPTNFDPTQKYPLVVVVHGGPATASLQLQLDSEDRWFYPTLQFLARGILVLKPNYRGSDGRGHAFLELNQGNLGTGELWDVESGIDHLIEQGYVDASRIGCAGWSHGGFVAAFATTHSDRFAAVSIGAGVTNWTTYYATSNFHRFSEKNARRSASSNSRNLSTSFPCDR